MKRTRSRDAFRGDEDAPPANDILALILRCEHYSLSVFWSLPHSVLVKLRQRNLLGKPPRRNPPSFAQTRRLSKAANPIRSCLKRKTRAFPTTVTFAFGKKKMNVSR